MVKKLRYCINLHEDCNGSLKLNIQHVVASAQKVFLLFILCVLLVFVSLCFIPLFFLLFFFLSPFLDHFPRRKPSNILMPLLCSLTNICHQGDFSHRHCDSWCYSVLVVPCVSWLITAILQRYVKHLSRGSVCWTIKADLICVHGNMDYH